MTDQLFQTRLRTDMAAWVNAQAEREGETAASLLRRLVYRAANRAVLHAWVCPQGVDARDAKVVAVHHNLDLEVLERRGAEEMVCVIYMPGDKRPVGQAWFMSSPLFNELHAQCLVLKGSPWSWKVVGSLWDDASCRAELTIQQQRLDR